ncbi:MAG: hypothetical protein VYC17_04405 [Nitrospinota bacterium]|nr:hypothetical protein [Nitrospinota bacterium]
MQRTIIRFTINKLTTLASLKEIENLPNADDQQMAFTALANETVILTEEDHATRVNDHDLAKKSMRLTKTILARLG